MKNKRGMGCATKGGGCVVKRKDVADAAEGVTPDMLEGMAEITGPMLGNVKSGPEEGVTPDMLKWMSNLSKRRQKTPTKRKGGKRLPFEPMVSRKGEK